MTPAPNPERRNTQARRAILDATIELIARDGYANVTIEAIASAAGVGKTTIYRWWPSKGTLALEAINDHIGDVLDFPDTGDITVDLRTQITEVVGLLNSDIGVVFRGAIAEAQSTPAIGTAILDTIIEPRTRACEVRLARAVADGQLRADVPTRVMVEMFYSPLYYRLLFGTDILRPQDVGDLLDYCLNGLRPQG
ncbi:TetR family transcriptional regulator [Longispora fulva]|uniref:AcrR family transcriptional regulator n=1 Tax=Longispora fulva TaxID=619741 RepID=A0A8J7GF73_9ACTN|nr:TetR/AcrR family transcriptional regulator [Longispora fulva]MBG6136646.1 AcrR family transcriptional regulator [Longispora fulva]GIG59815.1 TetR family transcriptional regulator [Longispora fulva]